MLIRLSASSPKSFICPSSKDVSNEDDNPQLYWDFKNWNEVSYGYQVPYGKYGKPTTDRDMRVVLVADKGPYGAALENGQPNPGIPNVSTSANPEDWMRWNSPNHGGEGQNVLYADSHVEYVTKPTVGMGSDNIYTRWSGEQGATEESARAWGTPPTSNETPWSDTDSLIYP
jgi:prepilin-type processing-associated H-X9-DG protein